MRGVRKKDFMDVLRYLLSSKSLVALGSLAGWYLHDHVVQKAKMHMAEGARIHPTATFIAGENIYVGTGSQVNRYCCLWASRNSRIVLGNNVMMGPGVGILSSNHGTAPGIPMKLQPLEEKDVVIGNDVWLGAHCVVLPGVTVHDGAVVAAGAVVSRDIPPYTVVGGVPACVLRKR